MAFPTTHAVTELPAINQILASIGQAPVTTLDQTNPDVAIAYDTLLQVSREVQSEGWTFNKEYHYPIKPDSDKHILFPVNALQMDLSDTADNREKDVVRRTGEYTVFPTAITVNDNGTGGGTNGTVLNKPTTTTGSGTGLTVNLKIESNVVTAISVIKPGVNYIKSDKITIAKADSGTTADVTGTVSETTEARGICYDRQNHTFEFTGNTYDFDVVWFYNWVDLPGPIQDYITARATTFVSSRMVGDASLHRMCQEKELYCRAGAIEYECNQGQFTYFGHPANLPNRYTSYQPYEALRR